MKNNLNCNGCRYTVEKNRIAPEKGLAMAIAKKALGNRGNYFNRIKVWTEGCSENKDK